MSFFSFSLSYQFWLIGLPVTGAEYRERNRMT